MRVSRPRPPSQNSQATRYTVLLDVNRAYFDVLHAQAAVKVAEQTVAARQLLDDQVTELAKKQTAFAGGREFRRRQCIGSQASADPRAG